MGDVEDTAGTAEDENAPAGTAEAPAPGPAMAEGEKRVAIAAVAGLIGGALLVGTMLAVPAVLSGLWRAPRGYAMSRQVPFRDGREGMMGQPLGGRGQVPECGDPGAPCPGQSGGAAPGPQSPTCPGYGDR